jgi:hypothetical protein
MASGAWGSSGSVGGEGGAAADGEDALPTNEEWDLIRSMVDRKVGTLRFIIRLVLGVGTVLIGVLELSRSALWLGAPIDTLPELEMSIVTVGAALAVGILVSSLVAEYKRQTGQGRLNIPWIDVGAPEFLLLVANIILSMHMIVTKYMCDELLNGGVPGISQADVVRVAAHPDTTELSTAGWVLRGQVARMCAAGVVGGTSGLQLQAALLTSTIPVITGLFAMVSPCMRMSIAGLVSMSVPMLALAVILSSRDPVWAINTPARLFTLFIFILAVFLFLSAMLAILRVTLAAMRRTVTLARADAARGGMQHAKTGPIFGHSADNPGQFEDSFGHFVTILATQGCFTDDNHRPFCVLEDLEEVR